MSTLLRSFVTLLVAGCGGSIASSPSPEATAPSSNPKVEQSTPSTETNAFDVEGIVTVVVTNKTHVCWSSRQSAVGSKERAVVACVEKSSQKRIEFARDAERHEGLALGGNELYWSNAIAGTIAHAPVTGGTASLLVATNGPRARFLLADTGAFYWLVDSDAGHQRIMSVKSGENVATPHASVEGSASLLSVVTQSPSVSYYTFPMALSFTEVGLLRTSVGSDTFPELMGAGHCQAPVDLVSDGRYAYWSCRNNKTFGWNSVIGDDEHELKDVGYGHIAPYKENVYLLDESAGRLLKVDRAAAKVDVAQTKLDQPTSIAVDESGVYVAESRVIRRFPL